MGHDRARTPPLCLSFGCAAPRIWRGRVVPLPLMFNCLRIHPTHGRYARRWRLCVTLPMTAGFVALLAVATLLRRGPRHLAAKLATAWAFHRRYVPALWAGLPLEVCIMLAAGITVRRAPSHFVARNPHTGVLYR